jgi:hypothetical protein
MIIVSDDLPYFRLEVSEKMKIICAIVGSNFFEENATQEDVEDRICYDLKICHFVTFQSPASHVNK